MQSYSFDDLENLDYQTAQKPFFAIDITSEDELLKWLNQNLSHLQKEREGYLQNYHNNYLRYKGYQYFNDVHYPRDVVGEYKRYTPQIVLPMISDAIDDAVSRLLEMKPSVVTIPVHDEQKDKIDAKVAKRFLQHVDHSQNLDGIYQKVLRSSYIAGESFLWVHWNPDLGDVLPDSRKRRKTDDGVSVIESILQGDVSATHKTASWVFYERADRWENVNYCFVVELDYTEALRLEYPKKRDLLVDDAESKFFDYETMEKISTIGKIKKIHFYHKKTKYLPDGFEAIFTSRAILKKGPISYKHGKLPIIRMIDIENDEELAGQSSIDKTKNVAIATNNLLNSMVKMFMLAGFAKWFVEAGSVDDQHLNNDLSIVKIKQGAQTPKLAQANPVGAQHFSFLGELKGWFYEFMKSNSIVRGEPPTGVTAGVALQYVSESESRRMRTKVTNFNTFVRETNQMILDVVAQFYLPDDERTFLVQGKDNRWEKFPLDIESITKPYNVMIQNTSGLSDSKAVRTQQVIDLAEAFPNAIPREQVLEMTGIAQNDKFYDVGSAAARAAEDENEWIQDGKGQVQPTEYEEHITHWRIHVQSIQSLGFKQKAPPEISQAMRDHIMAHEMMMMDAAAINPVFAERLALECPQFPIFMEPPLPPPPTEEEIMAADMGNVANVPMQGAPSPEEQLAAADNLAQLEADPLAVENPEFSEPMM